MRRLTVSLAVMGLALTCGSASAEPIRWSYSMAGGASVSYPYVHYFNGNPEEAEVRMFLNPVPEREFGPYVEYEYYDRQSEVVRSGASFRPYQFGDWGVGGTYGFRSEVVSDSISVTMSVRDIASDETAELPLSFTLYYSDSIGDHLYLWGNPTDLLGRVTLGGRNYEFRRDSETDNAMFVSITSAVAQAPEPATLPLAGLGLIGVFARRGFRRRAS